MLYKFLTIMLLLNISLMGKADENSYELKLKGGSFVPESLKKSSLERTNLEKYAFQSNYYAILQFSETPSLDLMKKLESLGIYLGDYIPNFAFEAKISTSFTLDDLEDYGIRAMLFLTPEQKINAQFTKKLELDNLTKTDLKYEITIAYDEFVNKTILEDQLQLLVGVRETNTISEGLVMVEDVSKDEIKAISNLPFVYFIDPYFEIEKPLLSSAAVHTRARYFQNQGFSPHLTGNNIKIGILEKYLVDHIDVKGRVIDLGGTNSMSDIQHSTQVVGVAGGNGNINPDIAGVATKSIILMDIGNSSFDHQQRVTNMKNAGATLSNHSYGAMNCPFSCPYGLYNNKSKEVDTYSSLASFSKHLSIYAVGNSGNTYNSLSNTNGYDNRYNTVVHNGNIAKNVLSVGGITNLDISPGSWSYGPTNDGRLKPELVAEASVITPHPTNQYTNDDFGLTNGTSFAAPNVAGGAALLIEDYVSRIGQYPRSGLLKAVLCNTADDLEQTGPDFKTGFGRPNFKRAYESMQPIGSNYNYYEGSISTTGTVNETITIPNVPAGAVDLNVTLYWVDPAPANISGVTLVNDLDLTLEKSNKRYYPWILNHADQTSSPTYNVEDDATKAICTIAGSGADTNCTDLGSWLEPNGTISTRKKDELNNIEKVTVVSPSGGNWTVKIKGNVNQILPGGQKYFVVWEYRTEGVEISFPKGGASSRTNANSPYISGESFKPGETFYISMEPVGNDFIRYEMAYRDVINPQGWSYIDSNHGPFEEQHSGNNLPVGQVFYKWTLPEDFDHTRVVLRMIGRKNGSFVYYDTQPINIIATPELCYNVDAAQQKIQLTWTPVDGADEYEVYKVGSKEMELLATVSGFSYLDNLPAAGTSEWYSVKAIDNVKANGSARGSNTIVGKRARAIEVTNSGSPAFYANLNPGRTDLQGFTDITAIVTPPGSYTFVWDDGSTGSVKQDACRGKDHSVTITPANGCPITFVFEAETLPSFPGTLGNLYPCAGFLTPIPNGGIFIGGGKLSSDSNVPEVWPNPANTLLNVNLNTEEFENCEIRLFSLDGKELISKRISADVENSSIDVSNISNGIYLVKIITDGKEIHTQKLTIAH